MFTLIVERPTTIAEQLLHGDTPESLRVPEAKKSRSFLVSPLPEAINKCHPIGGEARIA